MLTITECFSAPTPIGANRTDLSEPHMLIVDPHPVVRQGIQYLGRRAWKRCAFFECETAQQASAPIRSRSWSVIIVGSTLPDQWFIEFVREVRRLQSHTPILVFSAHDDEVLAESSTEAGANAFFSMSATRREIITTLRRIVGGETGPAKPTKTTRSPLLRRRRHGLGGLSPRERHVLTALGKGIAQKEIARELDISTSSVATHISRISRKLGVRSKSELLCNTWKWRLAGDESASPWQAESSRPHRFSA